MQLYNYLEAGQDGALAKRLAGEFGIARQDADNVARELVSELSHAVDRQTLSRGGVADLIEMVGHGDHAAYLEPSTELTTQKAKQAGDAVLEHWLGSKHQSRGVAARVARTTNVEPGTIEEMLPAIAAMMMAGMEDQLGSELGAMANRFSTPASGAGEPRLAPQQPLPVPGDDTTYASGRDQRRSRTPFDDLSDMIRRGGRTIPGGGRGHGGVSGSDLSDKVRDIFGNLLGFQNTGIVGWIIRVIVIRWGWRILKSILRRALLGR